MYIAFCRSQGRNNAGVKKVYYCIYPSKRPYIDYIYFQTIHKTRYFPPPIEKTFNLFLNRLNSFRWPFCIILRRYSTPSSPPAHGLRANFFDNENFDTEFHSIKNAHNNYCCWSSIFSQRKYDGLFSWSVTLNGVGKCRTVLRRLEYFGSTQGGQSKWTVNLAII